jgi:hypothetical protein
VPILVVVLQYYYHVSEQELKYQIGYLVAIVMGTVLQDLSCTCVHNISYLSNAVLFLVKEICELYIQ